MSDQLLYQIALTKIPKIGNVKAKQLISYCGGVEAVFKATKKELLKIPNIGAVIAKNILQQKVLSEAEKEVKFIEKYDIDTFFYLDKNYPSRLKHHNDSPVMLYHKGNTELNTARTVAIIGTRKQTSRGKAICEELVEGLRDLDVLVVSGLAYGVDITAHKKCVALNIPTVGIMGHGLDRIYPPEHKNTTKEMVKNGGLLTEFTSGTKPDRENFPQRNRIIAGLSDAVIVVETAESGGSIITAHMANDYNKDVFAVPGRINDKFSIGCNRLIKTHKAALLESIDDLVYIMRWDVQKNKTTQRTLFVELEPEERQIVELIRNQEDIDVDGIAFTTQFSTSQLSTILLTLELKGIIKPVPGKRFIIL